MVQGIVQTLLVRLPLAYVMSIQPNASLAKIGMAAPVSTAVGILLNVGFYLYLSKKALRIPENKPQTPAVDFFPNTPRRGLLQQVPPFFASISYSAVMRQPSACRRMVRKQR